MNTPTTKKIGMKQEFSSYDFVAFQLVAGKPPPARGVGTQFPSSVHIADRLAWIANCNAFESEYFNEHYPNGRWIDFIRDYTIWCEFHYIVRQEKENDEQENTSAVRTD